MQWDRTISRIMTSHLVRLLTLLTTNSLTLASLLICFERINEEILNICIIEVNSGLLDTKKLALELNVPWATPKGISN